MARDLAVLCSSSVRSLKTGEIFSSFVAFNLLCYFMSKNGIRLSVHWILPMASSARATQGMEPQDEATD